MLMEWSKSRNFTVRWNKSGWSFYIWVWWLCIAEAIKEKGRTIVDVVFICLRSCFDSVKMKPPAQLICEKAAIGYIIDRFFPDAWVSPVSFLSVISDYCYFKLKSKSWSFQITTVDSYMTLNLLSVMLFSLPSFRTPHFNQFFCHLPAVFMSGKSCMSERIQFNTTEKWIFYEWLNVEMCLMTEGNWRLRLVCAFISEPLLVVLIFTAYFMETWSLD